MAGNGRRVLKRWLGYEPLPSQKVFHDSEARFKVFSGPVGSGKTMALCQEVVRYTYQNKGRTGLVGAPTYPMLRDATVASLCELLDYVKIAFEMNKSTNTMTIQEVGSRILFRSLDEYERLRGTSLAWFGVDELTYVPEQAWLRLEARLRDLKADLLGGFGVGTPNGFDWVYRRFRADPVKGSELIEAKPFENSHVLDRTPDYYERLQASYDEQFYRQEVLGEFVNTRSGQVYYGFQRKKSTSDSLSFKTMLRCCGRGISTCIRCAR